MSIVQVIMEQINAQDLYQVNLGMIMNKPL